MRTRFAVLAALLCGLIALVATGGAGAAPRHNKGLTIAATPNPILAGEEVLIYGQLLGSGNSDQRIFLYHRVAPDRSFSLVGTTLTDSAGQYEFNRADGVVMTNRDWFVRGPNATHSRTVHERVSALVNLHASSMTGLTRHRIVFTGGVLPDHPYQRVLLQQQNSSGGDDWHTIATTFTGGASHFALAHAWARPGDYTVRALFPGDRRNIAGASDTLTVEIQQAEHPAFTISSSSPVIVEGQSVMLTGILEKPGATTPEPSTEVTLYGKTANHPFEALGTTATGNDGSYKFTETPVHNTVYVVKTTLKPIRATAPLYEGVQDMLTINASSMTATVGGSVTISGTVSPDKAGHTIYLQRLGADGEWHVVATSTVTPGSTYSFTYTFGDMGPQQLRARIPGGPENIGSASAPVTITVSGVAPVSSLPPAS